MSSNDESNLKAGHPPAVKAGGMRITQHKSTKEKPEKDVNAEEGDDHINSLTASTSPPKTTLVSGAPVRGNADFPTEAVQHFHNKPQPTHDARPTHDKANHIQQPRK
ncbi:hypothetical protein FOCC_FOCC006078 [Frankliniella occidentalis]|uniref:Death-associated protein 1 n=1 Tax=Frankliniella occidentalis TaxID=133901 RepID=A0A6J1SUG9_FRAOC|nr:death-associated protein 1 [Frankliniella occidentalis]KAE8747211.1 hypothetical protein FOCC_FOCC006078 [Frankliniella occidentalis]